jgi:hypothetical protein
MATGYDITNPDGNNLIGSTTGSNSAGNSAQTFESINDPGTRIDFSVKWTGADGAASATWAIDGLGAGRPSVGLFEGIGIPVFVDVGAQLCYKEGQSIWTSDWAALSIDWDAGSIAGTIKEQWYGCTYNGSGIPNARVLLATRDNIDPGYGVVGSGRPGPRYTFIISGAELRGYTAYRGGANWRHPLSRVLDDV